MKIAFVLDDTLDTPDGIQQYILGLGKWLEGQGHEVHYLVGQTTRTDIANVHSMSRNVAVRFNGNHMSMPLPTSRRAIKKLLDREHFDVLHVQVPYSPFMAHRVILAAPSTTAIVGTFHIAPHSALVRHATKVLGLASQSSLRRFTTMLSVSQAAADFARQTYGVESMVLPNVVDIRRFAAAKSYPGLARKPTIVSLGRLVPRKGCALLLEAIRRLHIAEPDFEFQVVVCGKGPLDASLKSFVQKHQLGAFVQFAGFVSEEEKAHFLKSADLAVFPSSGGESFGIVLIEAMAAGTGVVLAANNPGYAAVMAPYPDLLFPVGDADSLMNKIRLFLTNDIERKRALEWQASYVPQFDTAIVGRKLLAIYNASLESVRAS